jgi:hypothetical protein
MDIEGAVSAQASLGKQALTVNLIKQSADASQQVAAVLQNALLNVPTSSLGSSVDISA